MDSTLVCSHAHKHTYAHILLLQFLNCHQEWFIYSSIGCSFLWKLLTDATEFCVFLKLTNLPWGRKNVSAIYHFAKISKLDEVGTHQSLR